jgi:hypothetical protein
MRGSSAPTAPGTDPAPPPGGWPGRTSCAPVDEACQYWRPGGAYRWAPDAAWVVYLTFGPPEVPAEDYRDYQTVRLARLDGSVDVALAAFATPLWALPSPYRVLYSAYTYHTGPFSPDRRFVYYVPPEGELWSYELATGRRFYLEALTGAGYGPDVDVIPVPAWRPLPTG